jgi:hypothetical protein
MTRLVNEALRDRFSLPDGLANSSVTLADPAMGTGTFLLEVLRSLAATVCEDQGPGAVPGAVDAALSRLIGFEIQLGPFAVAQLRILAEVHDLGLTSASPDALQTFVTNTLDNPYVEDESLGNWYEPIARSRREANRIKKDEPVMVVLGNPPYRERSHGQGGWIESGTPGAGQLAPLPAPSAARSPSGRRTAGSPAGENTQPPGPAARPATPTGHHRLPWQPRLPHLERVSQLVMIAAAAPFRSNPPDLRQQPHHHELPLPYLRQVPIRRLLAHVAKCSQPPACVFLMLSPPVSRSGCSRDESGIQAGAAAGPLGSSRWHTEQGPRFARAVR